MSTSVSAVAAAYACPARLIRVIDKDQFTRVLVFLYERCTYCGRCAEVCPEGAIEMTRDFELSTDDVHDDMIGEYHIFMGPCERCGRCYRAPSALDKLQRTGMRQDQIDRKCAVPGSLLRGRPPLRRAGRRLR